MIKIRGGERMIKTMLDNNFVRILKGIAISGIITFVLLFIYSIILTYTNIGENTIAPVIILITAVSILARKYDKR